MQITSESRLYAKITLRLLPLLILGYVMNYLDRVNVGFAKLQMLTELGFSETAYGFGASIFFIGYVAFEAPSNMILHKIGARIWLSSIMFIWAILSGACMTISSETSFYVLRFFLGIAEAGFFPGAILYITYWWPDNRKAKIVGLFMSAIPLSGIIGGPISCLIMNHLQGMYNLSGWQWMFLLEAIPTFLLGFVFLKYLPNGPKSARFLTSEEQEFVASKLSPNHGHGSLGTAIQNRKMWFLAIIYFCQIMGIYGFTFWLPSLVKSSGIAEMDTIGYLVAIPYIFAILTIYFVTTSSDRYQERHIHHSFVVTMGAIGLIGYSQVGTSNPALSIIFLSIAAGGILSLGPLFWPIAVKPFKGAESAAAIGIIGAFANIAGFVSPFMMGLIKDKTGSNNIGLYIISGFVITGTLIFQFTRSYSPK